MEYQQPYWRKRVNKPNKKWYKPAEIWHIVVYGNDPTAIFTTDDENESQTVVAALNQAYNRGIEDATLFGR